DGTAVVTFRITEGEPVRIDTIEVVGAEEFEDTKLLDDLPLRAGDRLSTLQVDATRDTLIRRLTNRGYARADVLRSFFIPTANPLSARVTYEVAPGARARYGPIDVTGNESLSDYTVIRTLQFRPGDVYRASQLQEAQGRLFGLEIVRSANVRADLDGGVADSIVPISVRVQEGDPHRVRAGAGWSSTECLDVEARWVSRNWYGGGRRLQLRGRVSNILTKGFQEILCWQGGTRDDFRRLNWLVSADLTQPWIFSTRNSFQASVFAERQTIPPDILIRNAVGATLALTRAIGPRTPLTASYRPEYSWLDAADILFCQSFLVCTAQDLEALENENWLAPVALTFTRSTTDNVLNPGNGYTMLIDLEHAASWTGSDFPYSRLVSEVTGYERVNGRTVLAGKLRVGWVGAGAFEALVNQDTDVDIVHPQKRFYAGGANSVRGFGQGRLGPRVLSVDVESLLEGPEGCPPESVEEPPTCDASAALERSPSAFAPRPTGGTRTLEGSVELRFPLSRTIAAAGFADFGQVWGDREDVSLGEVEITPGFGLRYLSPIGPLRFDVGYRFRGEQELSVITSGIREFNAQEDDPRSRITVDGEQIPWVKDGSLAFLPMPVSYSEGGSFWQRLQIHISIGQAF
ncbi:MAG TPA: BamA/TamA family outer membrane protein, partial [Longimicrobiales bacterium]|nr:BamA/TamA family outer membrane protein [Longimicrobiales bacterium]